MEEIKEKWNDIINFLETNLHVNHVPIESWIVPLEVYKTEGNCVYLIIPNQYKTMKGFYEKKYKDNLEGAISAVTNNKYYNVEFVVMNDDSIDYENDKINENNSERSNNIREALLEAGLNDKYTFDTFVVGESNKLTYSACLATAESPGDLYNPLFLYGDVGLGKTHLMHSIARYIIENMPDKKVLYVTSEKFTTEVISSIRNNATAELQEKYRTVDVLLIDDIQFLKNKDSTQNEFFHTFNVLFNAGKQIVISADKPPAELQDIEERLVSRFGSGLSTDIITPDYETRMAILQKKIKLDNYNLSNDVLDYIAANITSNIRELEGALNKLIAFNNLEKKEVTLEIAQHELRDLITTNDSGEITMDTIINVVTSHFNVTEEEILSKSRNSNIVLPRHIIMYLCSSLTTNTLVAIGDRIGGRDYTTVINAKKNISKKYKEDLQIKNTIDIIINKIKPH